MGVLTDYFRARDDVDAARVRSHVGGPTTKSDGGGPPFDAVEAKGIDHAVVLGQLVAFVRGVDWTPVLCDGRLLEHASGDLDEGPWVVALDDGIRDDLAGISPESLPDLAARWSRIEELGGADPEELRPILEDLRALALRARDAGEHLYEWSSL